MRARVRGLLTLTVATVQLEPEFGNVAANLDRALTHIAVAAHTGARLIVLPELTNTGYVFASREEAFALAEPISEGVTCSALIATARSLGVHIIVGLAERMGCQLFNTAAVIGPQGLIGLYRKVHLWGDENVVFEPGDLGFPVFHTPIGRLAAMICYDGWFPESYRSCALAGADIVCVPTNWFPSPQQIEDQPPIATTLCMAGAHCNGVVVAAANRVGVERGQRFTGQSLIVDHTGWPLAGPGSPNREEILYAELDFEAGRRGRCWSPFNDPLRDRRPEAYRTS